tara:strand:- start:50 stop:388 length:339 start_codon:yes stop_codon:yes gene_type:complete
MYHYKAHLERVVDGDTVDFLIDLGFDMHIRERVRLKGIDTPEIRTKDLVEKEEGMRAKDYVESLFVKHGPSVEIHTEYRRGKYGRTIGRVFFPNGDDLSEKLLEGGYAEKYL